MSSENTWGLDRFSCHEYFSDRVDVEARLYNEFKRSGGEPILNNPIYFFLGRNLDFERSSKNIGHVIELTDLSLQNLSLTYGDSMISFVEKNKLLMGEKYQNPLCSRLFRFESLQSIFLGGDYPSQEPLHIEVQLWAQPNPSVVKALSENRFF